MLHCTPKIALSYTVRLVIGGLCFFVVAVVVLTGFYQSGLQR